jgi:hypothetical protein
VTAWASGQRFLRGRMGHSFYHSMGFLDLVASSADEYVRIAVRLGTDAKFRQQCSFIIKRLGHVVWQRDEVRAQSTTASACGVSARCHPWDAAAWWCSQVIAEWEMFLLNSVGYHAPVRRAARTKLEAINARDARVLRELHAGIQRDLPSLPEVAAPTPAPTPKPLVAHGA